MFSNMIKASKALASLTEDEKYYLSLVFLVIAMSSIIFAIGIITDTTKGEVKT